MVIVLTAGGIFVQTFATQVSVLEALNEDDERSKNGPILVLLGNAVSDGELRAVGVPPAGITHFKFRWFKVIQESDGGEKLERLWDCDGARYSPTEADAGHKICVHALPKRDSGGFGRPMEATSETVVMSSTPTAQAVSSLSTTPPPTVSMSSTMERTSAPLEIMARGDGQVDLGKAQMESGVFDAFGNTAATEIPQMDLGPPSTSTGLPPRTDIFDLVASSADTGALPAVPAPLPSQTSDVFREDAFAGGDTVDGASGVDANDEFGDFGDFGGADTTGTAASPFASEVSASPAPPPAPVQAAPVDPFDLSSSLAAPAPPLAAPVSFVEGTMEDGHGVPASAAAASFSFENDGDDFGDFGDFDGALPVLDKVDETPVEVDRTAALSLSLFGDEDAESPGVRLRRLSDDGGGAVDIAEYVEAWVSLGSSVADTLEQSASVWKETVSCGHELAMQKNHQGQQWLAALTRVSFVAHCLEGALRHHGMAVSSPRRDEAERGIERIQVALATAGASQGSSPSLMDAAHVAAAAVALPGGLDPWSDSRAQIQRVAEAASALGNDAGRQPRVPHCSLSLIPLAPLKSVSVVEWEGRRSCLAPVANWWANRCKEVPVPSLD